MSGIATAIGAAAVIGGGAAIYGANKAASATSSASNAAISFEEQALQAQEAETAPYRALGTSNIPTYQNLLTGGGGPNAGANILQTLQNTPGYQATVQQGDESAARAAGASGLNLSGNQLTGVQQEGAFLGNQTYQQQLNNLLAPIQIGANAATNTASNIGQTAQTVGGQIVSQGQTTAGIDANEVAALTRSAGGGANQYLTYNALQGLNNPSGSSPYTYGPNGLNPGSAPGNYWGGGAGVNPAPDSTTYTAPTDPTVIGPP
jgi:hypothetical protein